jgi:glycerate kinase
LTGATAAHTFAAMRVLVAFDKFKDSLTSPEACAIARDALLATHADWPIDVCALTDGGEGFCPILTGDSGNYESVPATGPRHGLRTAQIGFRSLASLPPAAKAMLQPAGGDRIGIIEMASISGLALLLPELRDPWQTTTVGTGELMRAAAQSGVAALLLGVGGSATSDLGLGALAALGLQFLDARGQRVDPPMPARWDQIVRIAGGIAPGLPPIRIACDVTNPLLGPRGAAAIYGPQKGLRPNDLARLEHSAARLALLLLHHCGQPDTLLDAPGAGAAGGISFGLMAAAGAQLLPGFDLVSAWLGLEDRIAAADLVITGEGRFDDSSLSGKGPGAVATRALALGKRVQVFAGAVSYRGTPPAGLSLHAITPEGVPLKTALRAAPTNLARAVAGMARSN